ncbi:NAD(P)H-dependent flavin oxidoreductase [Saccharothrix algeriensis]|uniref:Propionate 3-nitronate monooxygenase n=1 Tax=Saccharothrix algeriensis TaxID=173560 RepID=A0ABS2S4S4_9PSEU|nr:nitronate monooxygenase [Saccharothrix algeriensis]MBM7810934.1 nitronate monooxygenase [Saccharothrix algeriensis]
MLDRLEVPVIAAPMAGGASTPELVAEVGRAGGLGFLAAGYLPVEALAAQLTATAALTDGPFGVNLFVPGPESAADLTDYRERVRARSGAEPGEPRWDDDAYAAKLELVTAMRVPVVSFTFGLPEPHDVRRLHAAGSLVVVTVTTPAEARQAAQVGADALCVQGCDAGGHRGTFTDDGVSPGGGELFGVLAALRLVRARVDLPLIAAGGLVHGADVAAVVAAGAVAAQLGTAFLRCPEAGTAPAHRQALADGTRRTELTRAFSGRPARGLVNRFMTDNGPHAPSAYPEVHHLTKPVRATGDPELMSLWAGQTYPLARSAPAAEVVRRLRAEAREALSAALTRIPPPEPGSGG